MLLIDVHAHMDLEGYDKIGGIDKVLEDCKKNNVKTIITNGVTIEGNRRILEMQKKYPIIKVALGIYPTHCIEMFEEKKDKEFDKELEFIEEQIKHKKCIAVGEVGLEYKEKINNKDMAIDQKNIQKNCLKKFIHIAKKHNVPIIIHSRGAELEVVELLEKEGMKNHKVIMHCFSGRKHIIQRIRDNKWYFSIPCNIDRSLHFQQIVESTPTEQLLTETDAPYLSPIPGEINTPINVTVTINKIAEIKKMTPEEVANIIYANYMKLFL